MAQTINTSGLTDEEAQVMIALVEAWNRFSQLPSIHPDHANEFRNGIHVLQNLLAARVVAREHDDYWFFQTARRD